MGALTPNTNSLNAGGYLPVLEFLKRCDQRTVGDLCSDNAVRVLAAALPADPNLAAALLDASGMLEAALTAGQRYAPSDLANLVALTGATNPAAVPNAGQGFVYRLLTAMTEALLWERRPDKGPVPEKLGWAGAVLSQLAAGERVLPFLEVQQAGLAADVVETAADVEARNLTSVQAGRLFSRRGDRISTPPAGGFGSCGGGWW